MLAAQASEQILGMNGFGEDLELMALDADTVEQIGSGGLAGE